VDATVNLALSHIPPQFLLIGLFLIGAFISTAIGTSMGTIATLAPLAASLAAQGAISPTIGMATVISGAMFGDSLSMISDTTIAAVMSQEADLRAKLKLNAQVASVAALITLVILFFSQESSISVAAKPYDLWLITPYIFLISLALLGVNVFVVLVLSIGMAGLVGFSHHGYDVIALSKDMAKGFVSMHDIMLLSLLVGGLSGLTGKGSEKLGLILSTWLSKHGGQHSAQLVIGKMVSVFDLLLANNTVAIIFSGQMARDIAKKHKIPPHYSATWLDTFSCTFQGIIPYGAQVLLASAIGGISPLSLMPHVYFCYALGVVSVGFILFRKVRG
jgi:Na+/H+ antiporter NhaC